MSKDSSKPAGSGPGPELAKLMGFVRAKPALPDGWIVQQSSTYPDRVYFFNVRTGAATWTPPGPAESGVSTRPSAAAGRGGGSNRRPS